MKAPSLDGQRASYLRKQLHAFRDGTRSDPQMSPLAKTLRDEQIERLAEYYSARPMERRAPIDEGARRLDPAAAPLVYCVRCHGADGMSPNDLWPNLAGQDITYMRNQIDAFSTGARRDDMMKNWGSKVDARDMERILEFFSGLASGP